MNENDSLQRWVAARLSSWRNLLPTLERLERGGHHGAQDALDVIDSYRMLGRDLSIARRVLPASRLTRALEQRYARLHAAIHRRPQHLLRQLLTLFRDEIPQIVHELRGTIAWVSALFVSATLGGWWLIQTFPELIALLASEGMIESVEEGRLWTQSALSNSMPASLESAGIFTNNIMVALMSLCLGLFFGLGTFYIVALNGLMLGSVFAFTAQHGLADELFEFVIAHGVVELSVICIASAAGVMLGESLIRPVHATRLESFQHAARRAARLMLLCVLLLIGAGLIEGEISLHSKYSLATRIAIGLGYGVIMLAALSGRLFGRQPLTPVATA